MYGVETVYGIDFSAAADDAGTKTWITKGKYDEADLVVETVQPVTDFLGCTADRETAFRKLRKEISDSEATAFGLDFPFSLPAGIHVEDEWLPFLERFPSHFSGPDDFRATCHRWTQIADKENKEIKRACEEEYGGLCAYNLWIYKMTYYGIQDLLRPLRLADAIQVPPFDEFAERDERAPIVAEVYPAGTLEKLKIEAVDYKGDSGERAARKTILDQLADGDVQVDLGGDREVVLSDGGGDALDSLLATIGVHRGLEDEFSDPAGPDVEGHIYA